MKTQEQQRAYNLFMQTNLTKTEIADQLGVNRRTIYQWSVQGDWDVLRRSARTMPSIIGQKLYHIFGHFTDHILIRQAAYQTVTKDEAYTLHKLVSALGMIRSRNILSETMESFTGLLEQVKEKDEDLAQKLLPHVEDYIEAGAEPRHYSMVLEGYNPDGTLPFPQKEMLDREADFREWTTIREEQEDERRAAEKKEQLAPVSHPEPLPVTPPAAAPAAEPVVGPGRPGMAAALSNQRISPPVHDESFLRGLADTPFLQSSVYQRKKKRF